MQIVLSAGLSNMQRSIVSIALVIIIIMHRNASYP